MVFWILQQAFLINRAYLDHKALPTLCCKNMEYGRPPLDPLSLLVPVGVMPEVKAVGNKLRLF
jgi:hypothetical protein